MLFLVLFSAKETPKTVSKPNRKVGAAPASKQESFNLIEKIQFILLHLKKTYHFNRILFNYHFKPAVRPRAPTPVESEQDKLAALQQKSLERPRVGTPQDPLPANPTMLPPFGGIKDAGPLQEEESDQQVRF